MDELPDALRILSNEVLHIDPRRAFGPVPRSRNTICEVAGFSKRSPFPRIVLILPRGAVPKV